MEKSGGLFRMTDTGPRYYGLGGGGKREKQTIRKRCHEVESGQGEVHGHNNNCVSCLEDDNECMVYVSYIVAWARRLKMNRPKVTFLVSSAFEILSYNWRKACALE